MTPSDYQLNYDTDDTAAGSPIDLHLDYVYGYRGKDVRTNLHYISTGELVYIVGGVIVFMDVSSRRQRFYTHHTAEVRW
jgi:microtubule-associated protein-like 1/2